MNIRTSLSAALLACTLPLTAQAASPGAINAEIKHDMAEARAEVRTEMAKARNDLDTQNLSINGSLNFGKHDKRASSDDNLPPAHITPAGDLVIDDKSVPLNAGQRHQVLAYRQQVISIAKAGINAGEKAAMAALEATDVSLFSLIVGGMTGSLERRVEGLVAQHVQPLVTQICRELPAVRSSQQALAASVPQFRPYARLEADDAQACERDVRDQLASR